MKSTKETKDQVKIVLKFRDGKYSKAFITSNPEKAVRIYKAKEYYEID